MSTGAEEPKRISVSRDAMRADLAELELRLVQEMRQLADKDTVTAIARDVGALDGRLKIVETKMSGEGDGKLVTRAEAVGIAREVGEDQERGRMGKMDYLMRVAAFAASFVALVVAAKGGTPWP